MSEPISAQGPAAPPADDTARLAAGSVAPHRVQPTAVPLTKLERLTVGLLSCVQAVVFAWGYVLPWDKSTLFVWECCLLTVVHLATAATCLLPLPSSQLQLRAWSTASTCSALFLGWATWAVATSGLYLSRLYGGLGQGMSAVLVAIWALVALLTVPLMLWGLLRTRLLWARLLRVGGPFALGLTLWALFAAGRSVSSAEQAQVSSADDDATWVALLTDVAGEVRARNTALSAPAPTLSAHGLHLDCGTDVSSEPLLPTAALFYTDSNSQSQARCMQASTLAKLAASVRETLGREGATGPVLVERLTGIRRLTGAPSWLAAFTLRPGLDGACRGSRCYSPWQLVAQSRFVTHSPLGFLGDLKFGASLTDLARDLAKKKQKTAKAPPTDVLTTWTSQSVAIAVTGEVYPLVRLHSPPKPVMPNQIPSAATGYQAHILQAQKANGQFRYTLDPFTRKAENRQLNLARQAGTLFALCEVGSRTQEVEDAARRGLRLLLEHHVELGERWALTLSKKDRVVRLGDSALPLVAMLACRDRVGSEFDEAINHLSQFVLAQQRADGSFATEFDLKRQRSVGTSEALYAPGQALLALTLLDALVVTEPELGRLSQAQLLTQAIQRGMTHVAEEHWDVPIYPFFFVEENWNCLTARAALARQRNDAYERFCLDYVAFKSRLIFTETSGVSPEFVGGFGFGNVIPPHNTGAAGFGEALAAAIAVGRARAEPTAEQEHVLGLIMGFLLRQQWTTETCPACAPLALGSMSEHPHSPITRIDFAQHAWAAVAHGAEVLRLTDSPS